MGGNLFMKKEFSFSLIIVFMFLGFAQQPDPFVILIVNGSGYKDGQTIEVRSGSELTLEAKNYGGRRAWCMEPEKYANMGRNIKISHNNENELVFQIGTEFRGVWKIESETAVWYGQLNDYLRPEVNKNTAVLKVPDKEGTYILSVKAKSVWRYDRKTPAGQSTKTEENNAGAEFKIVVKKEKSIWFSSENITASGDEDKDIRFRLGVVQNLYNRISEHILNEKYAQAGKNLDDLKKTLIEIKDQFYRCKKKDQGFDCDITFIGLPTDKAIKNLNGIREFKEKYKEVIVIVSDNELKIEKMISDKKFVITNNVLKSVFKNYSNWYNSLRTFMSPDMHKLWEITLGEKNLILFSVPLIISDWYIEALKDASILKDQVNTIKNLRTLQEFYRKIVQKKLEFNRKFQDKIDKMKPVEELESKSKEVLGTPDWCKLRLAK